MVLLGIQATPYSMLFQEKAGKRMKLPIPETWETQVSLKGNKPSTWEQLLGEQLKSWNFF